MQDGHHELGPHCIYYSGREQGATILVWVFQNEVLTWPYRRMRRCAWVRPVRPESVHGLRGQKVWIEHLKVPDEVKQYLKQCFEGLNWISRGCPGLYVCHYFYLVYLAAQKG
jgi:hypothetical protein